MTEETLVFTQSGGMAGLRKGCAVPLRALTPQARAGLAVLRGVKNTDLRSPGGRDMTLYRLRLPGREKPVQLDDRTLPAKARPLIAFLVAKSRPLASDGLEKDA